MNGIYPISIFKDFYKKDFDVSGFDYIEVPGHIQLQGYDKCQYINTMYPWEGHDELRPPHISKTYNPVGSYVKFFDVTYLSLCAMTNNRLASCRQQYVKEKEFAHLDKQNAYSMKIRK